MFRCSSTHGVMVMDLYFLACADLTWNAGSRPSSKGKPLHWTSCMKIAEDIAAGLLHLHQTPTAPIVHGNLKPSNVLLGPDFESCLTDYGLVPALAAPDASSAVSLLYRAPETRSASAMACGKVRVLGRWKPLGYSRERSDE